MARRVSVWSMLLGFVVAALVAPASSAVEAEEPGGAIVLVMDASSSMNGEDDGGQTLLDGAKQALTDVVNALPERTNVGLRVYGHTVTDDEDRAEGCRDTELIHPVSPLDRPTLLQAINGYDAVGYTPIGYSLEQAAADLPGEGPRSIILVSDGEDTCAPHDLGPEPCDVAEAIRADGVEVVIQTVGFALGDNDEARDELECIAEAGGGQFRDIDSAAELADTLEEISVREARRFAAAGDVVEGAPHPNDAPTIEFNTTYQDTVGNGEALFYRLDTTGVSELDAQAIREGVSGAGGHGGFILKIVDRDDNQLDWDVSFDAVSDSATTAVRGVAFEPDVDEVFLQISTDRLGDVDAVTVEFTVEADVDPAVAEPDEPGNSASGEPPADAASEPVADNSDSSLPAWAIAVLAVLTAAVIGLGIAVVTLLRRSSTGTTPPSSSG